MHCKTSWTCLGPRRGGRLQVAARLLEIGDKPEFDWVEACREDDRNSGRRRFDVERPRVIGEDHRRLQPGQFGREGRQSIISTICPAIFDGDVPAFGKADLPQPLFKGRDEFRVSRRRGTVEEPDHWQRRLLRARLAWLRRNSKRRYNLPPSHSIT